MITKGKRLTIDDLLEMKVGDEVFVSPNESTFQNIESLITFKGSFGKVKITRIDRDFDVVILNDCWDVHTDEFIIDIFKLPKIYTTLEIIELLSKDRSLKFKRFNDEKFIVFRGNYGDIMFTLDKRTSPLPIFNYMHERWEGN